MKITRNQLRRIIRAELVNISEGRHLTEKIGSLKGIGGGGSSSSSSGTSSTSSGADAGSKGSTAKFKPSQLRVGGLGVATESRSGFLILDTGKGGKMGAYKVTADLTGISLDGGPPKARAGLKDYSVSIKNLKARGGNLYLDALGQTFDVSPDEVRKMKDGLARGVRELEVKLSGGNRPITVKLKKVR